MLKGRSPLLLALAIALLIAAAGTGVAVIKGGGQPTSVVSPPSPSAQPTPVPQRPLPSHSPPPAGFSDAPPPAGVDVIWVTRYWEQVDGSLRIHAVDWGGHEVGRLSLTCAGMCPAEQSPDGSRLLVPSASGYRLVDSAGHDLGMPPLLDATPSWADDSRHLCVLPGVATGASAGAAVRASLRVIDASGRPKAAVTVEGTAWFGDQWVLRACSIDADRAVLALENGGAISALRVVQLSTGKTLYARDDPLPTPGPVCSACHVGALAATHDGRLALEESNSGDMEVRDLTTGGAGPWSARAPRAMQPLVLSWNGRLAVSSQGVLDVVAERTIWHVPESILQFAVRPAGDDVLVVLSGGPGADNAMRIVHPDGSDIAISGDALA